MRLRTLKAIPAAMLLAAPLVLSGCASFSPDGGLSSIQASAKIDLGADVVKVSDDIQAGNAEARARTLLKKGLTAERAVQVALLGNKGLQAAFNDLGISEAQYVEASLPPNPSLSYLFVGGGGQIDIERRIVGNLLSLLTLQARTDIAAAQFQGAQLKVAIAMLKLAADTRRQFFRAVAASEQITYLGQARSGAQTASELAKRLGETGAMSKLDQAREHAFYSDISAQIAKARVQQGLEKERLTRLMGLWGRDVAFALPSILPALPGKLRASANIEAEAIARRADLKLARGTLDLVAKQYGLTKATRTINALGLSGALYSSRARMVDPTTGEVKIDKSTKPGFELALEIPIFDWGEVRAKEAGETYMRAANLLAEKAVNVRSEARESYLAYKGAWDVARLYQNQVLPLRKIIQEEQTLQYNGMLADLFNLLQDARARTLSNMAAIDARRDFWIADADLKAAIVGGGISGGDAKPSTTVAGGE